MSRRDALRARVRGALGAIAAAIAIGGCASPYPPLGVVESVDLQRYGGRWYEIASIPNRFQQDCTATTAFYALREDGRIRVLNECRIGSPAGKVKRAEGVATVVDAESRAKLEVSFFWPFKGDYWIIDLAPDYRYAVVGHPSRDYLWILARTPELGDEELLAILRRAQGKGYDLARVQFTEHAGHRRPDAALGERLR